MPPIRRGKSVTPSTPKPTKATTQIQEPIQALKRYILWHESEGHSRKTESVYDTSLRAFFRYLQDELEVADLNQVYLEHIRAWLVWLRNTPSQRNAPRSSRTLVTYCRQVKAFFHWCYAEDLIDHDPTERVQLP